MNKLIIISILLLGHWTSSAANTDAYFFTNLTIDNGLGSNVTNSIVQDKYGFIWQQFSDNIIFIVQGKLLQFRQYKLRWQTDSANLLTLP